MTIHDPKLNSTYFHALKMTLKKFMNYQIFDDLHAYALYLKQQMSRELQTFPERFNRA